MDAKLPRVVVLGGGFAGLTLARALVKRGAVGKRCELTVVDRAQRHVYTPWLYEVATGFLSQDSVSEDDRELLQSAEFPFTSFKDFGQTRFKHGEISAIDTATKHIHFRGGGTLAYDVVVVALGAESNDFGIPGVKEYAVTLKTPKDGLAMRHRIHELLAAAENDGKHRHIVVAGAGPNGTELVTELANALHGLEARRGLPCKKLQVTLIDSSEQIFSIFSSAKLRAKVLRQVKSLGIEVREHLALIEVAKDHIRVAPGKDKANPAAATTLPADFTIWSGGIKVNRLVNELLLPKDPRGRVIVNRSFQVPTTSEIFVLGDAASMENLATQRPDPQTAQVAVAQARKAAKIIDAYLQGKPLPLFNPPKRWHVLLAIGGAFGAGEVFGLPLFGPHAFVLRRLVDLRYFTRVMPCLSAIRVWLKGLRLYGKND